MTYEIPGSVITEVEEEAAEVRSTAEATLPTFTSMLSSINSGSFFPHPDMSSLSGIGIDISGITGALNSAKNSLMEDIGMIKSAIEAQAKLALEAGTAFGEEQINSIIGSSPLGALSSIKSMISDATSSVSTISGLVGDAQTAAVSALQSSIGSTLSTASATAASARAEIATQMQAIGMASMLTSPMIPQLKTIVSQHVDMTQFNGFKFLKTNGAPSPSVAKAPDSYHPQNTTTPSVDSNPNVAPTSQAQQIFTSQIQGLNTDATSARVAYYNSFGANDSMSKDQVQSAFNSWVASNLTTDQLSIRDQAKAILSTQPDSSTWSSEQATIVSQYKELKPWITTTSWFQNVQNLSNINQKYQDWYKQAYDCYMANGNIYSLPTDLVTQLQTYA